MIEMAVPSQGDELIEAIQTRLLHQPYGRELVALVQAVGDFVHAAPHRRDSHWTDAGWAAHCRLEDAYMDLAEASKRLASPIDRRALEDGSQ